MNTEQKAGIKLSTLLRRPTGWAKKWHHLLYAS